MAAAMKGTMVVRNLFLAGQAERVAQAMCIAVELSQRGPDHRDLPSVIDMACRSIMAETVDACNLAGLDDVQCETLVEMSRRGIEAFAKACGMAILEDFRAGRFERDWDALLFRIDRSLPRILDAKESGFPGPSAGHQPPRVDNLL